MDELILKLGKQVKDRAISWTEAASQYKDASGEDISGDTLRCRYFRRAKRATSTLPLTNGTEFTTRSSDGAIEAQKIVEYNAEIMGDNTKLLAYLGHDASMWEFVYVTISTWQQHTREQITKNLYAVRYKIRPLDSSLSIKDAVKQAQTLFSSALKPARLKNLSAPSIVNNDLLMEIPPVELHLGKLAWNGDTGEDYDSTIACTIFNTIVEKILEEQAVKRCGQALIVIGSDLFNSDTVDNTTTKGTLQQNDMRFKKMFRVGLKLYSEALLSLLKEFGTITVMLCPGNHDYMMSFYLYVALQQYFANTERIIFSTDYKDTQAFKFGDVGLFFNHGDVNLKRLQQSIPAEFYELWGQTRYRELHVGHLHKEVTVDDQSGMITRRIGSPTGTDAWHYQQRFVGATKKHQVFVWHKHEGLLNCKYIPFSTDYYKS